MSTGDDLGVPRKELLTEARTAELLGLRPATLNGWRVRGVGPPYVVLNARVVRYRQEDVEAWLRGRRVVPEPEGA